MAAAAAPAGTQGKAGEVLAWSFGLRNGANRYLTAESFKFKLATSATIMKKKEIWFLEQTPGESHVCIRSHLRRYLKVNSDGYYFGDGESPDDDETHITIEAQKDGRWALKSKKYGYWIGNDPSVDRPAFETDLQEKHKWTIHLAMHPQVCLRNVKRKAYVHLADPAVQLQTDELIPWGDDATITLSFFAADGTYGLVTSKGTFLSSTGNLMEPEAVDDSCKFVIVFEGGQVSFQAKKTGKFLTSLGKDGTLKATKTSITADEQFVMEDSFPQIKLTAGNLKKKVSTKQGKELAAKRDETEDTEIFQIEPVGNVGGQTAWSFKGKVSDFDAKFWTTEESGSVHAAAEGVTGPKEQFIIEWHGNEIALKSVATNKYVKTLKNGYLKASGESADEEDKSCLFVYEIINRPRLVLRGEYGFIGQLPSGLLECNKSTPEVFTMHITQGYCKISNANKKYWKVMDNGISCIGDEAEKYTMELHADSMMCLKFNGKYFEGFQNGAFTCTGAGPGRSTFFEY